MILKIITSIKCCRKFLIRFFIKLEEISRIIIDKLVIAENMDIHPKHKLMNYHEFFKNNIKKNAYVLDIGCGIGAVAFDIAKKAKFVFSIDLNKKSIDSARKKFNAKNIKYLVTDASKYDFKENFDYVVLSNVLEHIKDRLTFLRKIKKLAPSILIRVPMINRDWLPLYKKELGIFSYSDKTHYTEYTIESFKRETSLAGLSIAKYSVQFGEIWAVVKRK